MRRLAAVLGVLVVVLLLVVLALPWFLGTSRARRHLLAKANVALAPARVEVDSFAFSWFGPTQFRGVTLRDAVGTPVLRSPFVTWDRTLSQIVRGGPLRGTFDAQSLYLEIVRDADGDVTLAEALRPILNPKAQSDWRLRSHDGRFRMTAPGLKQPIDCDLVAIDLRRPPPPRSFVWSLDLAQPPGDRTIAMNGEIANPLDLPEGAKPDQTLAVVADGWPLDLALAGGAGTTRLSGQTRLSFQKSLWTIAGDSQLTSLTVTPPGGSSSPIVLGDVAGKYDVTQTPAGWTVKTLNLDGDLGTLRTESATIGPRPEANLTGHLDLARLAAMFPDALPLGEDRRIAAGIVDLNVQTARVAPAAAGSPTEAASYRIMADLNLHDLRLVDAQGRDGVDIPPYHLAVTAEVDREPGTIDLPSLTLTGPTGTIEASGRLTGVPDDPQGDLNATLRPNWESVQEQIAARVDPDATLTGGPLTVHVVGPLAIPADTEDLTRRWRADLSTTIESADVYGMTLGKTPIAAHVADGAIQVEPIVTVLNGGALQLAPQVDLSAEGGAVVRFDRETSLHDAEITEEVSRRFLTYLVPVVAQTARARGLISVQIDHATFPLKNPARADVQGLVVFRDAEFVPGPIADDVLDLLRNTGDRTVRLEKPVLLAIADGRVYQRDLSVRLGNVARFLVDGTVGFDETLDLVLRVPLQAERFEDVPVFNQIAPEIQVTVPVTGTLQNPKVDGGELVRGLGRMGLNIAEGAARGGIDALIQNVLRPRTPEEQAAAAARRAERQARQEEQRRLQQERREQRRMRRGR